jgi:hypothetical protein
MDMVNKLLDNTDEIVWRARRYFRFFASSLSVRRNFKLFTTSIEPINFNQSPTVVKALNSIRKRDVELVRVSIRKIL